jgi:ribose 5-phosphate isomerase B
MIVIGSDHAGYQLKSRVAEYLKERGIEFSDIGVHDGERGDYPVYAWKAAHAIMSGEAKKGILFCGTGVGISIAANKYKGIRCVVCSEPYSARMSIEHNNCNMLALGARVIGEELAVTIVDTWLNSVFEGERHQTRVEQIQNIEDGGTFG